MLDAETQLVALLGDPVAHSLSPLMHNTAFAEQHLNWAYAAMRVRPDNLGEAVAGLRALGMAGANVTIPHKERIVTHLDALAPEAEAMGAVNTVVAERLGGSTRLRGLNTDVAGFLAPLAEHAERLNKAPALVFGAGGAARAVCYALLARHEPSSLVVAARRPEQAESLARDLASHDEQGALEAVPLEEAARAVRQSTLLVNATPVGMTPDIDETPWPQASDFSSGQLAYDLVYRPVETRFLREAAERSATPIGGLAMLVGQAAAAYRAWTERDMPTEVVKEALRATSM